MSSSATPIMTVGKSAAELIKSATGVGVKMNKELITAIKTAVAFALEKENAPTMIIVMLGLNILFIGVLVGVHLYKVGYISGFHAGQASGIRIADQAYLNNYQQFQNSVAGLTGANTHLNTQLVAANTDITSLQAQATADQALIDSLTQTRDDNMAQLEQARTDINNLDDQLTIAGAEHDMLQTRHQDLVKDMNYYREDIVKLEAENKKLQHDNSTLEEGVLALEEDVENLRRRHADALAGLPPL